MITGLVGLMVLIADIYAIVNIVKSALPAAHKLLWCLLILILPVLGFIIWLAAGPRD
jgi:hypothetical protein